MEISDISLKNFEISGNAQIRMEGSGLSVTAGEHGGIRTPKWRSLAEKVTLCMSGRMRNGIVAYSVLSFDGQGNENTVQTEEIAADDNGRFSVRCSFDPISLAVYQNAACFQIAVTAVSSGMELELAQFSLSEETHSQIRKTEERKPEQKEGMVHWDILRTPQKILFVGNSLLLGVLNQYGMCASSPQKDYAWLVMQEIRKHNPNCAFEKLQGSGWEHAESMEAFENWFWREENIYTHRPAAESFTKDLTLILIQLTDNVNTEKKIRNFEKTLDPFIRYIRELSPGAAILWIHGWYNRENTCDVLAEACNRWKIARIDISDLNVPENQAYAGQMCENPEGGTFPAPDIWLTHPGDRGMEKIAERILTALESDEKN